MASKEALGESYPMSGGDGPHSYSENSTAQKKVLEAALEMVSKAIQDKLDFSSPVFCENSNTFYIADFGCSIGSNTIIAMQNIIEAVELKCQAQHQNYPPLEFLVFFNDHTNNDFNTLFKNLPTARKFFAAGVPGNFHNCLFPKSTLHFGHSSFALHWLSKVPKEFTDAKSPAWNKDSIHCTGFVKEVVKAYSDQFKNDMEAFLKARAQELVSGGLMVIILPTLPDGVPCSETNLGMLYDLLGSCLMDMAKLGLISEEKVEAFNLPMYHPTVKELETLLSRNGYFSIERIDTITTHMMMQHSVPLLTSFLRAVMEELIKEHFGNEIVDSVFESFTKKIFDNYLTYKEKKRTVELFILLKRIAV